MGTAPDICDVTPSTHTVLSSAAHGAGVTLPVATPLYVTVNAVNAAGLETVSASDSFVGELCSCFFYDCLGVNGAEHVWALPSVMMSFVAKAEAEAVI